MELLTDGSIGAGMLVLLVLAVLFALGFEFVNGFHDTANAVATVIYTHSMSPAQAAVWSGLWNFLGVVLSSGAVAYGIVALLPVELVLHVGTGAGFAMVFALLLSAVIWNLSTWYVGLPASSSHTLIGSIIGVGLMNGWLNGEGFGAGVNLSQLRATILALLVSPVVGFVAAAVLLLIARRVVANPALYRAPEGKAPPPLWIRGILIVTCTGVSFAHGSNDGQKGMGLIMLVLIGLAPAAFALHLPASQEQLQAIVAASHRAAPILARGGAPGPIDEAAAERHLTRFLSIRKVDEWTLPSLALENRRIAQALDRIKSVSQLSSSERSQVRQDIYLLTNAVELLNRTDQVGDADAAVLDALADGLSEITDYIPLWVKVATALALGLGTMIGWKRIVVTIGEKIGKSHLTYAQGASAELVAMGTIGIADAFGVPVSTTHVLSSGIAGTMFANRSGLQRSTLRNILLAWVLTIPACVMLGSVLFAAFLFLVLRFAS